MAEVTSIGLDIAKYVFQAHGADSEGNTLFNRKLTRSELLPFFERLTPCLVGIEACGTSHHWGRMISSLGHTVRLINPSFVKPFVKRDKTDANDAEAINEAMTRPTMRFVSVKTESQQASAILFTTRALFTRQRTVAITALKSHLAEFGILTRPRARSTRNLRTLLVDSREAIPDAAHFSISLILDQIADIDRRIYSLEQAIRAETAADPDTSRLLSIPGVGPITAAAVRALVPNPASFKSARHFASWVGVTPRSFSSGGKQLLGSISKRGCKELRSLLFLGASSVLYRLKGRQGDWLTRLRKRKPFGVAAVALANKMARVIWALLVKGGSYVSNEGQAPVEGSQLPSLP